MGYMRHHSILVSSYSHEYADPARTEAVRLFGDELVSPASKEGWTDSDEGDEQLNGYVVFCVFPDGVNTDCNRVDWCEVQWADDDRVTLVTRHSDEDARTGGDE